MIKFGSKVKMHYSISNFDGIKFESTFDKQPITFTIGDGVLPQKLEIPLYGLSANEEQSIKLNPVDAFGFRDDKKIKILKREEIPKMDMIKIGNVLEFDIRTKDGKKSVTFGMIKEIKGDNISIDLNHPLAGQKILLKVKILEVI